MILLLCDVLQIVFYNFESRLFTLSHAPNIDVRKFPSTDVFSMASDKEYKQNKVTAVCVYVFTHVYHYMENVVMRKISYIVLRCLMHFGYMMTLMFSGERGIDGFKVTSRYTW